MTGARTTGSVPPTLAVSNFPQRLGQRGSSSDAVRITERSPKNKGSRLCRRPVVLPRPSGLQPQRSVAGVTIGDDDECRGPLPPILPPQACPFGDLRSPIDGWATSAAPTWTCGLRSSTCGPRATTLSGSRSLNPKNGGEQLRRRRVDGHLDGPERGRHERAGALDRRGRCDPRRQGGLRRPLLTARTTTPRLRGQGPITEEWHDPRRRSRHPGSDPWPRELNLKHHNVSRGEKPEPVSLGHRPHQDGGKSRGIPWPDGIRHQPRWTPGAVEREL